uniref:Uncharacterized protein n=1 Tax=Anguilla anguilla TaxID=7936 RepID=A0A0E9RBS5_ANGAN
MTALKPETRAASLSPLCLFKLHNAGLGISAFRL